MQEPVYTSVVEPYKYQGVVDTSPSITITRKIKDVDKWSNVLALVQDMLVNQTDISWVYRCLPPERVLKAGKNAPAYVPEDVDFEQAQTLAQWLLFHGIEGLVDDSHARQSGRARSHDEECRSENMEKFDDETFTLKQSTGVVRETKDELKAKREWVFACVMLYQNPDTTDADADGKPIDNPGAKLPPAEVMLHMLKIREIDAAIAARKRG